MAHAFDIKMGETSVFRRKTILVGICSWIEFEAIKAVKHNQEDLRSSFELQMMHPIMEPHQWQLCIILK